MFVERVMEFILVHTERDRSNKIDVVLVGFSFVPLFFRSTGNDE